MRVCIHRNAKIQIYIYTFTDMRTFTYISAHTHKHTHTQTLRSHDVSDINLHDFGTVVSNIREGIYPRGERVRHIHDLEVGKMEIMKPDKC